MSPHNKPQSCAQSGEGLSGTQVSKDSTKASHELVVRSA